MPSDYIGTLIRPSARRLRREWDLRKEIEMALVYWIIDVLEQFVPIIKIGCEG